MALQFLPTMTPVNDGSQFLIVIKNVIKCLVDDGQGFFFFLTVQGQPTKKRIYKQLQISTVVEKLLLSPA